MRRITRVTPEQTRSQRKKRAAAYARVSLETERLSHSLAAQVSHYSAFIQRNPDWEYAGVYSDEGVTGTRTSARPGFQQLIADSEAGKIDIIITKSISRFARNTVDLLKTVRRLKELGIAVYFEKEHIDTLSEAGELMLTLLASFAQEEVRSLSDNTKWTLRKKMAQGIPNGRHPLLGYRWQGDQMVIVPEEAVIVKRIFALFLEGKSFGAIRRELNRAGYRTMRGNEFTSGAIKNILMNVTYTGKRLMQRYFVVDPISKKVQKNNGELPQYCIENAHEAIIDQLTFDRVQLLLAQQHEEYLRKKQMWEAKRA